MNKFHYELLLQNSYQQKTFRQLVLIKITECQFTEKVKMNIKWVKNIKKQT